MNVIKKHLLWIQILLVLVLGFIWHQVFVSRAINFIFPYDTSLSNHLVAHSTPGTQGVALLGGSTTGGRPIPTDTHIAALLNQMLKKQWLPIEIYNLGIPGANPRTVILSLLQALKYRSISQAIYGISPDDFTRLYEEPAFNEVHFDEIKPWVSEQIWRDVSAQFRPSPLRLTYMRLQHFLNLYTPTPGQLMKENGIEALRESLYGNLSPTEPIELRKDVYVESLKMLPLNLDYLRSLKQFCQNHQIQLSAVIYPTRTSWKKDRENLRQAERQVLEDLEIPYIDLTTGIPENKDYFYGSVHLTPQGNQIVAEAILNHFLIPSHTPKK